MLEITLVKHRHSTLEDARALRGSIENCDIYGIENAFIDNNDAQKIENYWLADLNLSRSAFMKPRESQIPPEYRDYTHQLYGCLHKNKRPVFVFERYDQTFGNAQRVEFEDSQQYGVKALSALLNKDVEKFLNQSRIFWNGLTTMMQVRDKNIAQHLSEAESYIRERFGSLADKPTIRLCAGLGIYHVPEIYMQPAKVIIHHDTLTPAEKLEYMISNKSLANNGISNRDLLALGIVQLQEGGFVMPTLTQEQSHTIDEAALREKVKTMTKLRN